MKKIHPLLANCDKGFNYKRVKNMDFFVSCNLYIQLEKKCSYEEATIVGKIDVVKTIIIH